MIFEVIVLPRAKSQLYQSAIWWAENRSTEQALRWLEGFESSLKTLESSPEKHSVAPENSKFPFTVKQMFYGLNNKKTHRALFEVKGDQVLVYSVRHLAQKPVSPKDL